MMGSWWWWSSCCDYCFKGGNSKYCIISIFNCILGGSGCGASGGCSAVRVVVMASCLSWWWLRGGDDCGNSLCKGGSCLVVKVP